MSITWHKGSVERKDRITLQPGKPKVLWFTGLSGSGKSTLAYAVEKELHTLGYLTFVLDGDNVRHGLCSDLGFTAKDRSENIRRIGEVAHLFHTAGVFVLASFISPFQSDREMVRKLIGDDFVEIFVDCSLDVCEQRDPKGLYAKARSGELKNFTGISSPYEAPSRPELTLQTSQGTVTSHVDTVLKALSLIRKI